MSIPNHVTFDASVVDEGRGGGEVSPFVLVHYSLPSSKIVASQGSVQVRIESGRRDSLLFVLYVFDKKKIKKIK